MHDGRLEELLAAIPSMWRRELERDDEESKLGLLILPSLRGWPPSPARRPLLSIFKWDQTPWPPCAFLHRPIESRGANPVGP